MIDCKTNLDFTNYKQFWRGSFVSWPCSYGKLFSDFGFYFYSKNKTLIKNDFYKFNFRMEHGINKSVTKIKHPFFIKMRSKINKTYTTVKKKFDLHVLPRTFSDRWILLGSLDARRCCRGRGEKPLRTSGAKRKINFIYLFFSRKWLESLSFRSRVAESSSRGSLDKWRTC